MKQVSLVIGYGGIGQAIVKKLLASKHGVVIFHYAPLTDAEKKFLKQKSVRAIVCDITVEAMVQEAVADLYKKNTQVNNIIFAVASKLLRKKITDVSPEEYQRDFAVNVFGVFNVCHAIVPHLIKQKQGTITALTTAAIERNRASGAMGGYVSAKYALQGLLRQLAAELAPHQIRVNAVAPGFVRTGLHSDMPERVDAFVKEKNPMQTLTTADDVANVVAFLVSEQAASLTGLSIPVTFGDAMTL